MWRRCLAPNVDHGVWRETSTYADCKPDQSGVAWATACVRLVRDDGACLDGLEAGGGTDPPSDNVTTFSIPHQSTVCLSYVSRRGRRRFWRQTPSSTCGAKHRRHIWRHTPSFLAPNAVVHIWCQTPLPHLAHHAVGALCDTETRRCSDVSRCVSVSYNAPTA